MTVSLPKETVKTLAELAIIKVLKDSRKSKAEDDIIAQNILGELAKLKYDVVDDKP